MKFKIFIFAAIVVLFVNCSNDENVASSNNVTPIDTLGKGIAIDNAIYTDPIFINYIEATYADKQLVKNISTLELYLADNELSSTELANIHTALGYSKPIELNDYISSQKARENYLITRYNFSALSSYQKLLIFDKGFEMNIPEFYGKVNPCKTRVHAEAVLMHLGCVAGDFTVIAGIICHGAVAVWHSASLQECK